MRMTTDHTVRVLHFLALSIDLWTRILMAMRCARRGRIETAMTMI